MRATDRPGSAFAEGRVESKFDTRHAPRARPHIFRPRRRGRRGTRFAWYPRPWWWATCSSPTSRSPTGSTYVTVGAQTDVNARPTCPTWN